MSLYRDGMDAIGGVDLGDYLQYVPYVGQFFQKAPAPTGPTPEDKRAVEIRTALEKLSETQRLADERRREEERQRREEERIAAVRAEERSKFWRNLILGGALIGTGIVAYKVLSPRKPESAPAAGGQS